MRKVVLVGIFLVTVFLLLVGCGLSSGISNLSLVEGGDGSWYVRFVCSKSVDSVDVKVVDRDGVRYERRHKVSSLSRDKKGVCEVVLKRSELGDGFYPTGTVAVVAFSEDKPFGEVSASIPLPMTVPSAVHIEKAYKNGDRYVVVVHAEKNGEDAILGHVLRLYIGDMAGRQLYLRDVDVFHKKGSTRIEIPLSEVKVPYAADVLLKVKLVDFGLADQVMRRAWDRVPIGSVDVTVTADKHVKVCPKVEDKCVPINGTVEVKVTDGEYLLWSVKKSLKYEDFKHGWVDVGSVSDVKFSTTGYADVVAKVKDASYEVTGSTRLTGLTQYTPPTSVAISYTNGKSSVKAKMCFYRGKEPVQFYGKLEVSIYDGKTVVYRNWYKVQGESCVEKDWEYSWIGPTTGGRANLYVTATPVIGKSLKASKRLTGLWAKVYAVGEYIAGGSWTDSAWMKFYVTDAKFVKRGRTYYFGVYVTIYNSGGGTPYVSSLDFDAIDSFGTIYDTTYIGEIGEFESGRIYEKHSRKGWMFFEIPVQTNIYKVKYVKIGFKNAWGQWHTLVTIRVYPYMYREVGDYQGL